MIRFFCTFVAMAIFTSALFAQTCSDEVTVPPSATIVFDSPSLNPSALGTFSFQRNSPGLYFNKYGVLQTAPANMLRIDHHPFVCADEHQNTADFPNCERRNRGGLFERKAVNYFPYSNDFTKWKLSSAYVQNATYAGPDHVNGSAKHVVIQDGAEQGVLSLVPLWPGGPLPKAFTFSIYVKDVVPSKAFLPNAPPRPAIFTVRLQFLDSKGEVVRAVATGAVDVRAQAIQPFGLRADRASGDVNFFSEVEPITDGWYRISTTYTGIDLPANFASMNLRLEMTKRADSYRSLLLWGAQFETGIVATSPIITNGSAGVRDADVLGVIPNKGGQFAWYNDPQGNFAITGDVLSKDDEGGYLLELTYGGGQRQIVGAGWGTLFHLLQTLQPVKEIRYTSPWSVIQNGEQFKISSAYLKAADGLWFRSTIDGGKEFYGTTHNEGMPTKLVRLNIGSGNNQATRGLNGHVLSIQYRPQILSLDDHHRASSLGCRTFDFSKLPSNEALSDSCRVDDAPVWQPGLKHFAVGNKWLVFASCKDEGILSYRCLENVKFEGNFCKLLTTKDTSSGSPIWKTGSVKTEGTALYGHYAAAYKLEGLSKDLYPYLNSSFWLWSMGDKLQPDRSDCELDVNEGNYPNGVGANLFKHFDFEPQRKTGLKKRAYTKHWFHPADETDPNSLSKADHEYSLTWTPQEVIYYVDDQIVRRTPNYFCHKPARVLLSGAILSRSNHQASDPSPDSMKTVPDAMEGKNVEFSYIRSYLWKD